ncbi:Uncharacterized protein dnm_000980 [Desulfonema magnum]|uniref:Uncharacterized protein n=1 Tax=Desulfonema magnum TaxID=45655 RepID=A0A975GK38_9BACT|nr:Uncharacterized protein dnm_000980 [Desulfonema magnum]
MERSATHLVRWVALRSTHPTFFKDDMTLYPDLGHRQKTNRILILS